MRKQNVPFRFCSFAPTNSVVYIIQEIVLEIDDFDLEPFKCKFDFLAITEGDCPSVNCISINTVKNVYYEYYWICDGSLYCGNLLNIPTEITVQQNKACLTFHSDHMYPKRGFHITAKGKSKLRG